MRYSVLVLLLLAGPVQAESLETEKAWESESPDDIECHAKVAGFTIVYTYNSQHPPKTMPIEGLMCYQRDYETIATAFRKNDAYFNKYWRTVK